MQLRSLATTLTLILAIVPLAAAAPVVTGISPDSGPVGIQVQINGTGFGASQGSSTVTFPPYSQNAPIVSWSDTQITATVPSVTTTGAVRVTVGGVLSNTTVYFAVPAPQVASISPNSGIVGTQVTVVGSGFQATRGSSYLFVGGFAATIVSWSDTQIVATVNISATTGEVWVTVNGVNSNQDVIFTLPSPFITGLSPSSGQVGTLVTVNGSGFGTTQGTSTVSFNNLNATVTSWSDSQIVATVPNTALSGPVVVKVGGVASNSNVNFRVPAPVVTSISPTSGPVATQVTVNGSGFQATQGYSALNIGGQASVVNWSATQIVGQVAAWAHTGPVSVYVNGVTSNQDIVFTMPNPTITGVSPSIGPVGTQVQINGTGFGSSQGSSTVKFVSTPAVVSAWSDTQITATVPVGATSGGLNVTVGGVSSNTNINFTVPAPQITGVSPNNGIIGTQVTISGSGFGDTKGSSYLAFNGIVGTVVSWSSGQIVATVPSAATTGPVSVWVSSATSNRDFLFTLPNPSITGMVPTGGPVGTQVTLGGSGFGATQSSSTVKIAGLNASVSSWSDTQVVASVPTGATSSNFQVNVEGVNSNLVPFTVGSVVVTDVSPKAGPLGSTVTIAGSGFGSSQGSGTISFNNVSATSISSWTDTQIVALVPTGASTGAVKVVQGGSTSNTTVTFTVGGVAVNSVVPGSGPAGVQVQINGNGFGATQGTSTVTFNYAPATVSNWSNTQITALVPTGASTGPVRVTVSSVSSNTNVTYTIVAPVVSSVVPATGPIGTQVQVNGSRFGATRGTSTITFNGQPATSVISWTDTQIVATVPATNSSSAVVGVTVAGEGSNLNVYFTVPLPQVTSVSPNSGVVGTQFTLTGTRFGATKGSSSVYMASGYGYAYPAIVSWSDTQITGTVPAGALTGGIWVGVSGVGSSNTDVVFSLPNPRVASLSPVSGPIGAQVTISGTGFGATKGTSTVTMAGVAATVVSWSDTQIVANVPAVATSSVQVMVGGVTSNTNINFTVLTPQIASVSPPSGAVGTQITINGSSFGATQGSSSVTMYSPVGYPHPAIVSWSDTQIVATVSAGTYTGPVKVFTAAGASNSDVLFTLPNPTITSLVPPSGPVGTQVAVNGSGFGASQGTSTVAFNSQSASTVVSWSDTHIVAAVPTTATSGPVVVTAGGVTGNANIRFTVPPPHITSLSPTLAAAGHNVTITGSGFQPTKGLSAVGFNGYYASGTIVSWSDTQIVATIPGNVLVGPGPVYVNVNNVNSNAANFTVPSNVVTSVAPSTGPVGTSVTVSGSGFGATQGSSTIRFNGQAPASITSWSNTQIVATVPNTATTGPVLVTVNNIEANTTVIYTVPAPQLISVVPQGGAPGTQVTISGSGFQATQRDSTINFNGTPATVVSWSNTQIVASAPAGATSGPVTVAVNAVSSNTNVSFTAPNPAIANLAPPEAAPGGSIVLQGSGFGPNPGSAHGTINGLNASVLSWSDTAVTLQVPAGATSGSVTVTTFGVTSNSVPLTVIAAPSVASISPLTGATGSYVTIDGSGLGSQQSSSTVDFNGVVAEVSSWSNTEIVATVPANMISGPVNVTVAALNAAGPSFFVDAVTQVADSNNNLTTYTSTMIGGSWYLSTSQGPGCSTCTVRGDVQNTYDGNGNLLTTTDANGHTISYTYDSANNLTSQTAHLGDGTPVATSYTYNGFGEALTMTDPLGHISTNTYDSHGNLLTVTTPAPGGGPSASVTQFAYDTKGELTQITDPLGHITTLTYYSTGLIHSITDAQNHVTTYAYDTRGNRTSVIDPINGAAHPTTFAYDLMNRLTGIVYPDGSSVSFGYDTRGRRTSATDQNSRTTTYAYDDADRLVSVTDAASNVTAYGYDTEDNLTSITDANGHTTSFTYDAFGRVTQTELPLVPDRNLCL